MKKTIITSFITLAIILLTAGYSNGQSGKEKRNVDNFSEISFGISGNLYVKTGSTFSVVLEGEPKYVNDIETYVRDGRLIIRKQSNFSFNNERVDCYITMPSIKGLSVSGSGRAKIESAVEADAFRLSVSGSGKVYTGNLSADSFSCSISGSGDVIVEGNGSADEGDITISGSGSYSGTNFEIDRLSVNISGSGNCDCKAGDTLKATVSGSGNIYYAGNPRIDARASGSGHIRSK
jgi:hypothetical protein